MAEAALPSADGHGDRAPHHRRARQPDFVTALAAALLITFVVDPHLFFSGPLPLAHLMVGMTSTALALGVVTGKLVIRASSAGRHPLTRLTDRHGFDDALRELMSEADRTGEPLSAALLDIGESRDPRRDSR